MRALEGPVVFVDIETNGLNHVKGRVIEVGVVRVENGQVTATFNKLIDPETPIPYYITNLTSITDHDVADAPTFGQVAEELYEILDGALFVAHNVRFDYSFLKQEFARVGKPFTPKQLCTVRLSRALYPEYKSHKLAAIIERHNISVAARHRAYDDAAVLWEFLQIVEQAFEIEVLHAAISKQLKLPSLPKGLDPEMVAGLPETPGVYIFEDELGRPLYVGKSVHIRTRVKSHFAADHEHVGEFKIAQQVRNIRIHETAGELEALLLESRLVKELQPLFNKRLRKTEKLILVRQALDDQGYVRVVLEEASAIDPDEAQHILAVYTHRGKAKEALDNLVKAYGLCPKLCGLEKRDGACFMHQLHKCQGACAGKEAPADYNERLLDAFARKRVEQWPFSSPVLVTETDQDARTSGVVVDQWCIVGQVSQEAYCDPVYTAVQKAFDVDTYKILRSYLTTKNAKVNVVNITPGQLQGFLA
ncbi:MAG TPA: exonuclease domain-containing protein [Candidatus Saccharimonadales bacterium]|nr:exonuclease domain-containing protein [Candidatus Saccharimonadales bacterium]